MGQIVEIGSRGKHGVNDRLLHLYHISPAPIRSVAATLRGFYLRSWRYGPETQEFIEEACEKEQWNNKQWKDWQEERLAYVLHRAVTKVPFYREHWAQRRQHGDKSSWEELANWPVLSKQTVKENPYAFVAEDCNIREMFREHTSGTSGTPLTLWWSRETVRRWYALVESRIRMWNGISRQDRWAILGGQIVVPFKQMRPPFWVWNAGLRQLYMSSYHFSEANAAAYLEAMRRYRVVYMLGYASSMYSLARIAIDKGIESPRLKVAISNAEPLYQHQRETISQAFHCPVRDTYGMAEIVCSASECKSGALHLWPEVGVVEAMQDGVDEPVLPGQPGRFVCTGLLNTDMPLIRYDTGDGGMLARDGENCDCGLKMPILKQIEGRLDDIVVIPDGRRVGRLDPVFKSDLPIREAQIIQESLEKIRIRFVPSSGYEEKDGSAIVKRLRERVGDIQIVLEQVDQIPRSPGGKFRAVVSNVASTDDLSGV